MAFTAKDVVALREKTGCGMMDCKKALQASDGDMNAAIDFLREKGLAAAEKKSGRAAAEGIVTTYTENGVTVMVEINCETDFVGKTDEFKAFSEQVAKTVAQNKPADLDALLETKIAGEELTVAEAVREKVLVIGENIKVRRFATYEGVVSSYIHMGGKIGVMVQFETNADANSDTFQAMAKDVAMQVAAANPQYLDKDSVSAEVLEKEKAILVAQMKEDPKMANKPEQVLAKIVEGKIGKFYKENCLVEQDFVKDGDLTVAKYVAGVAKELGADIKVLGFTRFEKGEGLEKKVDDFAAEVAGMVK